MRSFAILEIDESELSRSVTWPAILETDFDAEDASAAIVLQSFDFTNSLTRATHAPEKGVESCRGAGCQQRRRYPTDRTRPVGSAQQHHRVKNEEQEDDREPAVGAEEPAIGDAFHQRESDQ